MSASSLAPGVLSGNARDVGRAISCVERGGEDVASLVAEIYASTGRAAILGVTGPAGAGKSTLVTQLAKSLRVEGRRVGIVAVDPSSPFSGGAILGDRIRMADLYTDPGVFIRSMATRGALGGLAPATTDAVDVLDAAGYEVVIIETVGVGQDEVDVVQAADSVAVVLAPGMGDDIQAMKAGVLEIADIFVVNKADREGADRTVAELEMSLDLAGAATAWRPPIVRTVAIRGEGTPELRDAFARHLGHLESSGQGAGRRKARAGARLRALLKSRFLREIEESAGGRDGLEEAAERLVRRETDPYGAAAEIFERFRRT